MALVDEERLARHDLTDEQWARLEPLLPGPARQGRRWADHRMVINGVFHRVRVGCPWRDLPVRFGPWQTVYNRHRRWCGDGTWEEILAGLRAGGDEAEGTGWTAALDSTARPRPCPRGPPRPAEGHRPRPARAGGADQPGPCAGGHQKVAMTGRGWAGPGVGCRPRCTSPRTPGAGRWPG